MDLILLSGGINDVKVDTILNPLTDSTRLSADCVGIEDPMYNVLIKLLNKCNNSKIIATSYYPIVSKDTPESALNDFAKELFFNDPNYLHKAGALGVILNPLTFTDLGSDALNSMRVNSNTFDSQSRESIGRAIDRVNVYSRSHFNEEKVFFVPVDFPSERSYGTSSSWLWKLTDTNNGGKTNAHKYTDRVSLCDKTYNLFCNWDDKIDAVGHPNAEGAREYANDIESIIKSKGKTQSVLRNNGIRPQQIVSKKRIELFPIPLTMVR